MATHSVTLQDQKEVNDQYVSFCFRCCGDETTDSWVTIALSVTGSDLDNTITGHQTQMAQQHDLKLQYRAGTHPAILAATKDATIAL